MTRPTAHSERRAFGRRDSRIHGLVEVAGRPAVHCIVRNFSRGGALIDLAEPLGVDENLYLIIQTHDFAAFCDVRHRNGMTIGVAFQETLDEAGEAKLAGTAPSPAKRVMFVPTREPVSAKDLRRSLFGVDNDGPVLARTYRASTVIRHP